MRESSLWKRFKRPFFASWDGSGFHNRFVCIEFFRTLAAGPLIFYGIFYNQGLTDPGVRAVAEQVKLEEAKLVDCPKRGCKTVAGRRFIPSERLGPRDNL